MTRHILTYLIIFISNLNFGQNCVWAQSSTGSGYQEGFTVCTDDQGNLYFTGCFTGPTITFGPYNLTNSGYRNVFLTKYNSNGNVLWTRSGIGSGNDWGYSVCADKNGNIYITGDFTSPTIVFGSYTLTNSGSSDIYLVKYDSNGNVLWAKSEGSVKGDYAYSVNADPTGNVFITGHSDTLISFGNYSLYHPPYTMYLTKYDSNGNLLWATSPNGCALSYAVTTDAIGNSYVTGEIGENVVAFGTNTLNLIGTNSNLFTAKFDPNGNSLWAKNNNARYGYSICTNTVGESYVIGNFFTPTISVGSYTFANNNTQGGYDILLTKYDNIGNVIWAKSFGSTSDDIGYSVASDVSNIYITGNFKNSIIFSTYTLTAPIGSYDPLFFVRLDFSGNVVFAIAYESGGGNYNNQSWVCTDKFGNVYIGSDFEQNSFNMGCNILSLTGGLNAFVAKYHFDDVGIKINTKSFSGNIYPNPNNGSFKVQLDNEIKNGELILLNLLGQKVHEQKIILGTNEIKTNGLPFGLYNYILLQDNQTIGNGKLTIE